MTDNYHKNTYTPREIGELLKLGRNKVYLLCALDDFPADKKSNEYEIDKVLFGRWLNRHMGKNIDINNNKKQSSISSKGSE